mgnify:CR=1 FL=1
MMIDAESFLSNFKMEWQNTISIYHDTDLLRRISDTWDNKAERTKFMLEKGGFLYRVMNRFLLEYPDLEYRTEIYTIDALYMGGEITYRSRTYDYPTHVYAVIEHENESNVEEEMWKLLLFRPALKILIFYDFDEHRKTTERRRCFVENKISDLQQMISRAHSFLPESNQVSYVCLIGNRKREDSFLTWRWTKTNARFEYGSLKEL